MERTFTWAEYPASVYRSFNDAVSDSDFVTLNGRLMGEWRNVNYVKGSGSGPT
jgi:hypothetical protein